MNLTHGQYINGSSITYVYNTLHIIHKFWKIWILFTQWWL